MNVRTVTFKECQGAEDLFFCAETKNVYIRQVCDDNYVRWLTSCKWSGGYEADCPMREGITIRVTDRKGNTLFEEYIEKVDGYCFTVAKKKSPLSYEWSRMAAKELRKELNVKSYEQWKEEMNRLKESYEYIGYSDTWCFWEVERDKPVTVKDLVSPYGERFRVTSSFEKHKICNAAWKTYEIRSSDLVECVEIIGFEFIVK